MFLRSPMQTYFVFWITTAAGSEGFEIKLHGKECCGGSGCCSCLVTECIKEFLLIESNPFIVQNRH
jgi:hypothetical protein